MITAYLFNIRANFLKLQIFRNFDGFCLSRLIIFPSVYTIAVLTCTLFSEKAGQLLSVESEIFSYFIQVLVERVLVDISSFLEVGKVVRFRIPKYVRTRL